MSSAKTRKKRRLQIIMSEDTYKELIKYAVDKKGTARAVSIIVEDLVERMLKNTVKGTGPK